MSLGFDVRVAARARLGILEAAKYIALDSPQAAQAFYEQVQAALQALEQMPLRGARVRELRPRRTGYRQILVGNYRLMYQVSGSRVQVLKFTHGARQSAQPLDS